MSTLAVEDIAILKIVNFLPSEIQTKLLVALKPHGLWWRRKNAGFLGVIFCRCIAIARSIILNLLFDGDN